MTVTDHRPAPGATQPVGASPAGNGAVPGDSRLPAGAVGWAPGQYYDPSNQIRVAPRGLRIPVDGNGRQVAVQMECPKWRRAACDIRWVPVAQKQAPLCPQHGSPLTESKPATWAQQVLPWRDLVGVVREQAPPLYALAAGAAAGAAADAAQWPAWAFLAAAPAGFEATRRGVKWWQGRKPDALRDAVARQAREVGYCTTAGCLSVGVTAAAGIESAISWTTLILAWLPGAATWWKRRRDERNTPPPAPVAAPVAVDDTPPIDPDEQQTKQIWRTILAAKPNPQTGQRGGKLAETWLEDWHRVDGGWGATACSPPGLYTAEAFLGARGAIASAFRMKANMITVIPDVDDETKALILAQRTSPIVEDVRWTGPASIDVQRGVAPIARYADGELAMWEMWRPDWGCPHVGSFGTTGSAKSSLLSMMFTIGRHTHYIDGDGQPQGIWADFLIDPQQGQSFAEFVDDLAAPPACSLAEAILMVEALHEEMLRRNRYLATVEWIDPRRPKRPRKGRKWWNPLTDGPLISLSIDEAHQYLADRKFAGLVTAAGRMWRKCGGQIRIATHTPLLSDLGGSMALRDMLTGGFVWVGRTANSLSAPTAFNGRLPVDPRTIPPVPGLGYILTGAQPKPMLARNMFEPDFYDWVRDLDDNVVGYPAVLPPVSWQAFGPEFNGWVSALRREGGSWEPPKATAVPAGPDVRSVDAVRAFLARVSGPLTVAQIDDGLQAAGVLQASGKPFTTRTVRDAVAKLKLLGEVEEGAGKAYTLTAAREEAEAAHAEQGALELSELDGVE